jgi:CDGSH-type Zn-finger protein
MYENGPLLLRGSFTLTTQDGEPIPAGRRTVALCRCGRSALKPFCDGSHVLNMFRAAGRPEDVRGAAEQRAGAAEGTADKGRTALPVRPCMWSQPTSSGVAANRSDGRPARQHDSR